MEAILGILCVLILVLIILVIVLRQKPVDDSSLSAKIEELQSRLREDLRFNREESAGLAKENRMELNATLKDFKQEMTETLKVITGLNQNSLEQINKTFEDKINALINKTEESSKANRETLSGSLKDFSLEQRFKADELKEELRALSKTTVGELEKITKKVEEKLAGITDQARSDSNQNRDTISQTFKDFQEAFDKNVLSFNNLQREKFSQLDEKQTKLIEGTEKKLEEMRATVDEKLQKTLDERLGQSFELVGKQLESVQRGLGEMQTLAQDVGGLKKVLGNVRMRGGFGEVQLSLLLEQILAPEQYEANVKTKAGGTELVEFAIKLPGRDNEKSMIWIPIDAKFPKDVYEHLQNAYEAGDSVMVEVAQKNLDNTIRKMAKDIRDKYIDPPNTTDFAIMFLPFEGIYAEVVRKASLLEQLQSEFKVIVTGPTTLAAMLNSLQMGFRSLAIQKRSSEVWQILGAVKKEFDNFAGMLQKAQNNLHTASHQLDEVLGRRTKAIQKKLKGVEVLSDAETEVILTEVLDNDVAGDGVGE